MTCGYTDMGLEPRTCQGIVKIEGKSSNLSGHFISSSSSYEIIAGCYVLQYQVYRLQIIKAVAQCS